MATMWAGVRPTISFASLPIALTWLRRLDDLSIATTEGSLITIPRFFTCTSVFAVPRSIPISSEKRPSSQSSGLITRNSVLACRVDLRLAAARARGLPLLLPAPCTRQSHSIHAADKCRAVRLAKAAGQPRLYHKQMRGKKAQRIDGLCNAQAIARRFTRSHACAVIYWQVAHSARRARFD